VRAAVSGDGMPSARTAAQLFAAVSARVWA
jgi:hypothetical protein